MTYANSIKYLRLMSWARERYSYEGNLVTSIGGAPSIFTRIERAAWSKYA